MAVRIITPVEVIKHSGAGREFPVRFIESAIDIQEELFFVECLGTDFWEYMQGQLSCKSTAEDWEVGTTYGLGVYVWRDGCLYLSKKPKNTTDPLEPECNWSIVEKFKDSGLNIIWEKYIAQIIAAKIMFVAEPMAAMQPGGGGLVKKGPGSFGIESAEAKDRAQWQKAIESRVVEPAMKLLKYWLEKNASSYNSWPALYGLYCSGGCNSVVTKVGRRNWNFN